jgi:putative PIN family toxin of toxin-antitoxin system
MLRFVRYDVPSRNRMPRLRVVVDTNVVVSAHLSGEGYPSFVVDLCLASRLQWFVSAAILEEYAEVLRRKRFRIDPKLVASSIRLIRDRAKFAKPRQIPTVCSDPDDNRFLECALEVRADYLVTGNKRHFPARLGPTRVVSPRELVEIIIPELRR